MRLVQFLSPTGARCVGLVRDDGRTLGVLRDAARVYDLALEAGRSGRPLELVVAERLGDEEVDYERLAAERRLLPPLDHPDPARCYISGTGLDHLDSALARNAMHISPGDTQALPSNSLRLFQSGVEGGKPEPGSVGAQPEWFYKGDGDWVVPPEHPLPMPAFALDGGEEAEVVGLYVIAESGAVLRVGFALGNEFADHVMERQNYLYVAHSKLRACSFGPELLVGALPADITGRVRLLRNGEEVWADTFRTGEANMSHSIANIEHHHFKYRAFRRPGDVHCHFFGASMMSCSVGVQARPGDVFEIAAPAFGRALHNPLGQATEEDRLVGVRAL